MATFNVELNSRASKNELYSVFIRITENRKSKKVKLSFQVPKEHFNKDAKWGRWIRTTNTKHKAHNDEIERKIDELRDKFTELQDSNLPALNLVGKDVALTSRATLKTYFDAYLLNLKADTAITYYKQQESKLNRFATYFGEDTPIAGLTPTHIAEFKRSLQLKGLSGTSVNSILGKIRSVFRLAVNDDTIDKDPFRANKAVKAIPKGKIKLVDKQIEDLENLSLPEGKDKHWLINTRNYYLFSYYNAGIRVADLIQLRQRNIINGRLEYEMDKTGHKKSIKLNKSALDILEIYLAPDRKESDYLFPILDNSKPYAEFTTYADKRKMAWEVREELYRDISSMTSLINKNLKKISETMELNKNLTFHTSRHSFADKARRAMKVSDKVTLMDIKNSLGHKKIATTEGYMNTLDYDSLDNAMDGIFE
jgi:integrase/recombinase XerD